MKLPVGDVLSEEDATLDDGLMPTDCTVLEVDAMPEVGTIAEDGFRTKLAEVLVKNPVDGAVPIICVPLFRP